MPRRNHKRGAQRRKRVIPKIDHRKKKPRRVAGALPFKAVRPIGDYILDVPFVKPYKTGANSDDTYEPEPQRQDLHRRK